MDIKLLLMGISIDKPCKEDWSNMHATNKGAFCDQCALEVIDFTQKSTKEIQTILASELSTEKRTCGRISNNQLAALNDHFYEWKNDTEEFRSVWMMSLLVVFGLTLFSCQNTASKEMVSKIQETGKELVQKEDSVLPNIATKTILSEDTLSEIVRKEEVVELNIPELSAQSVELSSEVEWLQIVMGDFVTYGGFAPGNDYIDYLKGVSFLEPMYPRTEIQVKPSLDPKKLDFPLNFAETNNIVVPNEQPLKEVPRADLLKTDKDLFEVQVFPNPITPESKIFVYLPETVQLTLKIYRSDGSLFFQSKEETLSEGAHQMNMQQFNFQEGEYYLIASCYLGERQVYFNKLA